MVLSWSHQAGVVRDTLKPTSAQLSALVELINRLNPDIVLLQHIELSDLNHLRPHLNRFLISFGQPSCGFEGGLGILLRDHFVLRTDHRYFHQVDGSSTGLGQTLLLTLLAANCCWEMFAVIRCRFKRFSHGYL